MSFRCEICNNEMMIPGPCDLCGHHPDAEGFEGEKTDLNDFGSPDVLVGSGEVAETLSARNKTAEFDPKALIDLLSDDDLDIEAEAEGFLDGTTGAVMRVVVPASVHVDRATQEMIEPACVLGRVAGASAAGLSVFEAAVFAMVDGERPNARIAKKCNLSIDDLKIALALLAERKVIELVGHAAPGGQTPEPVLSPAPLDVAPAAVEVDVAAANPALNEKTEDGGFMPLPGFDDPTDEPTPAPTPSPTVVEPEPVSAISEDEPVIKPRDVRLYEEARDAELAGDPERALSLLQAAVKLNPEAAPVYNRMGVLLATKLHRVSAGIEAIGKALEVDPNNNTYRNNLAKILAHVDSGEAPGKPVEGGVLSRLFKKK